MYNLLLALIYLAFISLGLPDSPLFGLVGNLIGFAVLPVYLLIFVILMICMAELTFRTAQKN